MGKEFTAEEKCLRNIIIKWAKAKAAQGEIEFKESYSGEEHICFRTKNIKALIQEKSIENYNRNRFRIIYWKDPIPPFHHAYEIGIDCTKKKLILQLVFNYNSISDKTKSICEEILRITKKHPPKKIKGTPYRIICIGKESINSCTDKDIKQNMDKLFNYMKEYETFIISKLGEEP